jgi:hexosaminidase
MKEKFYGHLTRTVAIFGAFIIFFAAGNEAAGRKFIREDRQIKNEIPEPNPQPTPLWERGYSVIPAPRNVELKNRDIHFSDDWKLNLDGVYPDDIAVQSVMNDLKEFHDIVLAANANRIIHLKVDPGAVQTGMKQEINKQAYRLVIKPNEISITGNALPGLFYGVQTFLQLINTKENGQKVIPECTITDWPKVELRVIHWDTKNHQDRIETLKRYLDWSARFKVNAISFEIWDKFTFPSHPVIGAPGAFTPAQMQEIVDYGLERHIQVIPNVQAPSHFIYVLKHPEFAYLRGGRRPLWEACICDERLYDLIFDMLNDLIECTKGVDYFYASTDELFTTGTCEKCEEPFNPETRSKHFVEFTNRVDNFIRSKGRKTIAWLEFPLLTEHVKLMNPEIIDGVGNGHLGYFVDDDEFIEEENKMGIQLINYTAIQGGEKLFPNYFSFIGGGGKLQMAFDELSYGRAWKGDVIGTFTAAWDDSGLHNETFWLGWATGAQYSWTPGTPSLEQTVSEFMKIYYGPKVSGMVDIYQDLQKETRFWEDSFWDMVKMDEKFESYVDWGGKEYMSYRGIGSGYYHRVYALSTPPLPQMPGLKIDASYKEKFADNLHIARELIVENGRLMHNIQEHISKVERNKYNLRVFLALADFVRHHLKLVLGLANVEDLFQQASEAVQDGDPPLAIQQLIFARDEIDGIIKDRELSFRNLKDIYEISRFPKGRTVDGREYVFEKSGYFAKSRPDLSFMTVPEEQLELEKYRDELNKIILEYGKINDLEGFYP